MSQATTSVHTKPSDCRIVPDLFGFTIHLNGARMYVLHEHLDDLFLELASYQEQHDRAELAGRPAAADLFPEAAPAILERAAGE